MRCVVCEGPVLAGQEHYGNPWERVRKKLPCCTATCAVAFDDDLHWIPPELPPVATGDAQVELRHQASIRLRRLDEARGVVRELLGVGLAPAELRRLVAFNAEATANVFFRTGVGPFRTGSLPDRVPSGPGLSPFRSIPDRIARGECAGPFRTVPSASLPDRG